MSGANKKYMFKTDVNGFIVDHDSNQYKRTTKKQMLDCAVSELNRLKKLLDDIDIMAHHTEDYSDMLLVNDIEFKANETRAEYQQDMFDMELESKTDEIDALKKENETLKQQLRDISMSGIRHTEMLKDQIDQQHKELQEIKSQVKSLLGLVS